MLLSLLFSTLGALPGAASVAVDAPQDPPRAPAQALDNPRPPRDPGVGARPAKGPTEVVFWMRSGFRPRAELDAALARGLGHEDARRVALAAAAAAYRPLTAKLAADLRGAGFVVQREDTTAPLVYATVPAEAVPQWTRRDDVWRCFPVSGSGIPEDPRPAQRSAVASPAAAFNEYASRTVRTDAVHRRGVDGTGVKVLVNDTAATVASHPYLPTIISGSAAPSTSTHATGVAGIVASSHPQHTGAAPGVTLYDHDQTGDFGAPIAWGWAMQQGVALGVCSWGTPASNGSLAFLDIYFDYIIRQFGVLMFKSAGNLGTGNAATTPGLGYNMVTVGDAHDNNTWSWTDDFVHPRSSTANPLPGLQEKPELVAPGESIFSTTPTGSVGFIGSGTSFAAPVVAGVAALLGQADPQLLARPEAMRALLLASAHNVDGADPLSDVDGAGMANAAVAHGAVADGQFVSTTLTPASFVGGVWSHSLYLDQGDAARIAAVWLSDSDQTNDILRMDLDMTVRDPLGQVVATSTSSANPFELAAFVPATSGFFTVELQQQRFQGTSEPFALAWATRWNGRTNEIEITSPAVRGALAVFTLRDRYHPFQPYAAVLSLTPYPATWTLPGDTLLRLGYDFFADASLLLPGFLGQLDFRGEARIGLVVPNLPALAGMTFQLGMVTMEFGVLRVEDVSNVVPVTVQ